MIGFRTNEFFMAKKGDELGVKGLGGKEDDSLSRLDSETRASVEKIRARRAKEPLSAPMSEERRIALVDKSEAVVRAERFKTGGAVDETLDKKIWVNAGVVRRFLSPLLEPFTRLKNLIDGRKSGAFKVDGFVTDEDFWQYVGELGLQTLAETVKNESERSGIDYEVSVTEEEIRTGIGQIDTFVAKTVAARAAKDVEGMEENCLALLRLIDEMMVRYSS